MEDDERVDDRPRRVRMTGSRRVVEVTARANPSVGSGPLAGVIA